MRTKVWAHRGASAYAPENTLEAFQLAIDMKADGIELDIYETSDGRLVIHHDNDIKRMTGGVAFCFCVGFLSSVADRRISCRPAVEVGFLAAAYLYKLPPHAFYEEYDTTYRGILLFFRLSETVPIHVNVQTAGVGVM